MESLVLGLCENFEAPPSSTEDGATNQRIESQAISACRLPA